MSPRRSTRHDNYVGRHRADRRKRADRGVHSRREPPALTTLTDWLIAIGAITFLTAVIAGFLFAFIALLFIPL